MLTRLELVGFKSFAEKTRFDFAPGITAVVGPNGSGKSNIIDAVKWVLGEQSARNLRGGEMLDVIFNGSSTRKSLGLAEVSLTFDNRQRQLSTEADEVQITRRVYRDGQGEYLINGQLTRLKDVKDLFLGSGAGHGAYSVIEQGRVDALLTASAKDRRAIFEEAAGISRFKVKKLETIRKLDRVDGDLTRVRDLLLELEKQLRTLRLQASKAQKYKEHTVALRDLRIAVAQREWHELTVQLENIEKILNAMRTDMNDFGQSTTSIESRIRHLKVDLDRLDRDLRVHEGQLAEARQSIAGYDASIRHERIQSTGLDIELLRTGKQRLEATTSLLRLTRELGEADSAAQQLNDRVQRSTESARGVAGTFLEIERKIAERNAQTVTDRELQYRLVNETAQIRGEIERTTADRDRAIRELQRKETENERLIEQREIVEAILHDLSGSDTDVQDKLTGARSNHAEHLTYRDELIRKIAGLQGELETQRERRSTLRGRVDLLEDLERRLEGLGCGVREFVRRRNENDASLSSIAGMIVELLTVPREIVHLVELALGERAHYFAVSSEDSWNSIVRTTQDLPGRVGLIPLFTPLNTLDQTGLESLAQWVSCTHPDITDLPRRLLGDTFLVPDIATAYDWQTRFPDQRFITRAGDLLEPDGTLVVGPPDTSTGVLTRKSELRDLREQLVDLDNRIGNKEQTQWNLRRQCESLDAPIRALDAEITALSGESGTLRDQIRRHEEQREQFSRSLELLITEREHLRVEYEGDRQSVDRLQIKLAQSEKELQSVVKRLTEADGIVQSLMAERDLFQQQHLSAQVELGRLREQAIAMQNRHTDLQNQCERRRKDEESLASLERTGISRLQESQLAILRATSASAEAVAIKEQCQSVVVDIAGQRNRLRADFEHLQELASRTREQWTEQKDRTHAHELQWNELSVRREAIQSRMTEEYQIHLSDLQVPDAKVAFDIEAANIEIEDLRQKIARLGNVNLEALTELEEVEKRESDLRSQHDDLADSHKKLREIIERINADSEILFNKTINDIRVHFQELFRKLFGGGMADIVMEDTANPLESGIEITARPPGKELRSISLLSGGERTLTAIALLLAVFRSRPSPFCLLDEVDAALDEANTERLAAMLREFVQQSQFIVITHKKRTMAVADVLYGVTMQESGVSKQVSVRFEDWEEGEQRAAA